MKNKSVLISLFYCSNSLTVEEISSFGDRIKDADLKFISLPCSGKVNFLYLLKAVETGSDAVVLISCKIGECRFLQGNMRAQKRSEAVNEILEETGLGGRRIRFVQLNEDRSMNPIITELESICKQIRTESDLVREKV